MYKINVFIDGETQIFLSLLYNICEGLNSFFSSETQKKLLSLDMSKNMSVVSFSIINSLDTQTRFWVDGEWNFSIFVVEARLGTR